MGRPCQYSHALAERILDQLEQGGTLIGICRQEGYPPEPTVRRWVKEDRCGFSARYTQAREIGYSRMAEEVIDLSDQSNADVRIDHETGSVKIDGEAINRSKLRVDSRKWLLAKVLPKVYGDRSEVEVNIGVRQLTDAQLDERITLLIGKAEEDGQK